MSRIIPNLYLGDVHDAAHHKTLESLGIRCIVIIAKEIPPFHSRGFTYMKINAHDEPHFDLRKHFREVLPFIHRQLDKGGVLVHCYDGLSRSAAVVLGYLMRFRGMPLAKALDFVYAKREIKPNEGFLEQLRELDHDLGRKTQSQILGVDSEKPSSRKPSRREDTSTPKFGAEPERPSDVLAKYMKGRDGSKSVTKRYCQMLEVYKKLTGKNEPAVRSKSKTLGSKDKRAKGIQQTWKKMRGADDRTLLLGLQQKKKVSENGRKSSKANTSHEPKKKLGRLESEPRSKKKTNRTLFAQPSLAMRTMDRDKAVQPGDSFFLEGIQPYLKRPDHFKNQPKTNKDRSVPKLVSVSQRYLSCEKEAEVAPSQPDSSANVSKYKKQKTLKNFFQEPGKKKEKLKTSAKPRNVEVDNFSKQRLKRSKFNNSLSSNPPFGVRTKPNSSKSQSNSVNSVLEVQKVSKSKKNSLKYKLTRPSPQKENLRKFKSKKKFQAPLKQRKCSISPPTSKSNNVLDTIRNSQPILDHLSKGVRPAKKLNPGRVLKIKKHLFDKSRVKEKKKNPYLEFLNNKIGASKHNNRFYPFTPRTEKSCENPNLEGSLHLRSSNQRSLLEKKKSEFGLKKESSTVLLKSKQPPPSKSWLSKAQSNRLAQTKALASSLRSQLLQINNKRLTKVANQSPINSHTNKSKFQSKFTKEPNLPKTNSRLLVTQKTPSDNSQPKRFKKQFPQRRNKRKQAKFGSPGISKLKNFYSKLKSHSIDFEHSEFQILNGTVSPETSINKKSKKEKSRPIPLNEISNRHYQSSKGISEMHLKETLSKNKELPELMAKASKATLLGRNPRGNLSNSNSKSRNNSKSNHLALTRLDGILPNKGRNKLAKINLYKKQKKLKAALSQLKSKSRKNQANHTQERKGKLKHFFPNFENRDDKISITHKSNTGLNNLKPFRFFKLQDDKRKPLKVSPSSHLNNSLKKKSKRDLISKLKSKKVKTKKLNLTRLQTESSTDNLKGLSTLNQGKFVSRSKEPKAREKKWEDFQNKEASKDSTISLGSEGISSNGSLNLYSKHKTNRYLAAKKKGQKGRPSPNCIGFIKNPSNSTKNIGMVPNLSLESSEGERSSANLYQRMALDKNSHKSFVCANCSAFFCRMESFNDHSKKFEMYRCKYYFTDKLDNVGYISEEEKKVFELRREGKKLKKIQCVGCHAVVGNLSEKDQKCSCLVKVGGKFRLYANMVNIKD